MQAGLGLKRQFQVGSFFLFSFFYLQYCNNFFFKLNLFPSFRLLIMFLYSSCANICFSIDSIINQLNLLLYVETIVTNIVNNILYVMHVFGK